MLLKRDSKWGLFHLTRGVKRGRFLHRISSSPFNCVLCTVLLRYSPYKMNGMSQGCRRNTTQHIWFCWCEEEISDRMLSFFRAASTCSLTTSRGRKWSLTWFNFGFSFRMSSEFKVDVCYFNEGDGELLVSCNQLILSIKWSTIESRSAMWISAGNLCKMASPGPPWLVASDCFYTECIFRCALRMLCRKCLVVLFKVNVMFYSHFSMQTRSSLWSR